MRAYGGMLWRRTLCDESEATKFRRTRRWMSSLRWEPNMKGLNTGFCIIIWMFKTLRKDHLFTMYAKFPKKIIFCTPWHVHILLPIKHVQRSEVGGRMKFCLKLTSLQNLGNFLRQTDLEILPKKIATPLLKEIPKTVFKSRTMWYIKIQKSSSCKRC